MISIIFKFTELKPINWNRAISSDQMNCKASKPTFILSWHTMIGNFIAHHYQNTNVLHVSRVRSISCSHWRISSAAPADTCCVNKRFKLQVINFCQILKAFRNLSSILFPPSIKAPLKCFSWIFAIQIEFYNKSLKKSFLIAHGKQSLERACSVSRKRMSKIFLLLFRNPRSVFYSQNQSIQWLNWFEVD